MSKTNPSVPDRSNTPALLRLRGIVGGVLGLLWGLLTGLLIVVTPGARRRRRMASTASRGLLRIFGLKLELFGALPEEETSCVAIANHASYLDGIVLTAVLPPNYAFVIKREMMTVPLVGLLLRRLNAVFVDRSGNIRGQQDGRHILNRAGNGESIGIFPEGTFRPEPGLLAFRPGAFVTAMRAGRPVLPISIAGSRRALPAETWQIHPGKIQITFHPLEWPQGRGRRAREALTQQCREAVLRGLPREEQLTETENRQPGRTGEQVSRDNP